LLGLVQLLLFLVQIAAQLGDVGVHGFEQELVVQDRHAADDKRPENQGLVKGGKFHWGTARVVISNCWICWLLPTLAEMLLMSRAVSEKPLPGFCRVFR